ncbi:hypothetical protein ACFDR9_000151 [Janthinobacterium sp. CG_23.3]
MPRKGRARNVDGPATMGVSNLADAQYGLAILDRPGRHFHRHRGAPSRRHAGDPQAAVRESGAVPRRRRGRHPPPAARGGRRAHPGGAHRGRQDGHHGGHQRFARTQGRADRAGHHARLPRRAAHRLPEPAAAVRPADRAARAAVQPRRRDRRARRRARRAGARAGRGRRPRRVAGAVRAGPAFAGDRFHARLPLQRARGAGRRDRPRNRLHPSVGVAPGQSDDEAGGARRYHRRRRLPVADPAALRRPAGRRDARRPPAIHAVERRPERRARLPGQGQHPQRAGRRRRRHGARQPASWPASNG